MDNLRLLDVSQRERGRLPDINMDTIVNADNFDLARYYVEIHPRDYWIRLGDHIRIHTLTGLVTFLILSLCIPDVFWFVLYWLQVPFLGLNGASLGRLYVPHRATWDNEVNTRQWGCSFYVFSANKCGWEVLFTAVLIYLGVYPITYFLVPAGIVQSTAIIIASNLWYFWKIWAAACLVLWTARRVVPVVWHVGSLVWIIFDHQREFMKEALWRRRHLACLALVILLTLCPSCHGRGGPQTCEKRPVLMMVSGI